MNINRSPELVELIPSIGARIALQNYFCNKNIECEETEAHSQLYLPSTSTSCVSPTVTFTVAAQEMFDMIPDDSKMPINCDTQALKENAEQLVEASAVNETQKIILLDTSYDDKPAEKRVEIVNTTMVCMILQNLNYNK